MGVIGLIGRYDHTIDSNGRLSIPAKFREYITTYSEGCVIMTTAHVDSCVVVYPLPEWNAITQRATQMDPAAGESGQDFLRRKDFLRIFYSRAVDSTLDKQGRILLPGHLREYAGLEKDTVLVGHMNVFEIWDVRRWKEKETQVLEHPERLREAMASLGI
jgi:MraZ protein